MNHTLLTSALLRGSYFVLVACVALLGSCTSASSENEQAQGFRVIKTPTSSARTSVSTLRLPLASVSSEQLQKIQEVSQFKLFALAQHNSAFLLFEVTNSLALSNAQLQSGLDAINALPFVDNARFETKVKGFSIK